MGEEIASRGEGARTGSLNGDGQRPQEVSKLSTGVIRGSEEGEFTKKLVGFAVYGTQIVDCKDDKPSRGHVRVKVPCIKSMLFSSAMGRRVSRRIVRCIFVLISKKSNHVPAQIFENLISDLSNCYFVYFDAWAC